MAGGSGGDARMPTQNADSGYGSQTTFAFQNDIPEKETIAGGDDGEVMTLKDLSTILGVNAKRCSKVRKKRNSLVVYVKALLEHME